MSITLAPEEFAALRDEQEARHHGMGHAYGLMIKSAGKPTAAPVLSGRLVASKSGWLLLTVPNALVRGLFDAMDEEGIELPPNSSGALNAHISVMTKEEVAKLGGPEKITERGHSFSYQLGPMQVVDPKGWDEMSKCWFVVVQSPELRNLRKSYGLSPLPNGGHDFHISVAVRRKKVLTADTGVAKAASVDGGGDGGPRFLRAQPPSFLREDTPDGAAQRPRRDGDGRGSAQEGASEVPRPDHRDPAGQGRRPQLPGEGGRGVRHEAPVGLDRPRGEGGAGGGGRGAAGPPSAQAQGADLFHARLKLALGQADGGGIKAGPGRLLTTDFLEQLGREWRAEHPEWDGTADHLNRIHKAAGYAQDPDHPGGITPGPVDPYENSSKTNERGEPCPPGECCPHCRAQLERGDDGTCNRCGEMWPNGHSKLAADRNHDPEYVAETEQIKANREKPENQRPHAFQRAKWTHPNGHPRCKRCGDEEPVGGTCEGYDPERNKPASDKGVRTRQRRIAKHNNRVAREHNPKIRAKARALGVDLSDILLPVVKAGQAPQSLVDAVMAEEDGLDGQVQAPPRSVPLPMPPIVITPNTPPPPLPVPALDPSPQVFNDATMNALVHEEMEPDGDPFPVPDKIAALLPRVLPNNAAMVTALLPRRAAAVQPVAAPAPKRRRGPLQPPRALLAAQAEAADVEALIPMLRARRLAATRQIPTGVPDGQAQAAIQPAGPGYPAVKAGDFRDRRDPGRLLTPRQGERPDRGDRGPHPPRDGGPDHGVLSGEGGGHGPRDDPEVEGDHADRLGGGRVQGLLKAGADFAPGLPRRGNFGDLSRLRPGQLLDYVVQHHRAQVAGPHYDVRLGNKQTGMYSWAARHGVPVPGEKNLAVRQSLHRHSYNDFEGTIPRGYGAGQVRTHDKGRIMITHASPERVEFTRADTRHPERFVMIKPRGFGKDADWLMINATPTQKVPYDKLRYKKVPHAEVAQAIRTMGPDGTVEAKVDGASQLTQLLKGHAELTSYRTSKETGRPIVNTEKVLGGRPKFDYPKHLEGSILKGELYASPREGHAAGPQDVGTLLNSSIEHSLNTQRDQGTRVRQMIYDIQQYGNKPVGPDTPRADRRRMMSEVAGHLPSDTFHLSEPVPGGEPGLKLWDKIRTGQHPLTREGVVIHPSQGVPMKGKLTDDHDVYVTGTFPGKGQRSQTVGGFTYGHEPGKTVGKVGSGFTHQFLHEIARDPAAFTGRVARVNAQEKLPSGALRAPVFLSLHEDYNKIPKAAALLPHVKLQPQQERVKERVNAYDPRMLVYHGLGSGKSLASIASAEQSGQPYAAVVPAALRPNYNKELAKFTDGHTPASVLSYTQAGMGQQPAQAPHTLILDEAQRLRNPDSQMTKNVKDMAMRADRVLMLSGTPVVNRPNDLATPLSILTRQDITPQEFDRRFVGQKEVSPGLFGRLQGVKPVKVPTIQHEEELEEMLRGHVDYHPSKTPEGVHTNEERVEIDMSPQQKDFYRLMFNKLPWLTRWKMQRNYPMTAAELQNLQSFMTGPRQAALSLYPFQQTKDPMRAFNESAKLQRAFKDTQETLKTNPQAKVIAYSNFIDAGLTPYEAALKANKIPYSILHGKLNDAERKQQLDNYNTGKSRVLLYGPSSAEGISAQGTQMIQLLDPHWNEARMGQAQGRGLRFDSHNGLPEELKNVAVRRYIARMPEPGFFGRLFGDKRQPSADEFLDAQSRRKEELLDQYRNVLKRVGSEPPTRPWWSLFS